MVSRADVCTILACASLFGFAACGGSVKGSSPLGVGGAEAVGGSAGGNATTIGGGSGVGGAAGAPDVDVPPPTSPEAGPPDVGTILACVPGQSIACACVTGERGAQTCNAKGTYDPCVCESADAATWEQRQLARLLGGIVGTWSGMETNPWNSGCPTTMTFDANGHYTAHSMDDTCIVFYYGSNDDTPEKTYLLDDVLPTAEGQGEIVFWFSPGDTNAGTLRHVSLSADENELKFEAWKGESGPFVFSLKRVSR